MNPVHTWMGDHLKKSNGYIYILINILHDVPSSLHARYCIQYIQIYTEKNIIYTKFQDLWIVYSNDIMM